MLFKNFASLYFIHVRDFDELEKNNEETNISKNDKDN